MNSLVERAKGKKVLRGTVAARLFDFGGPLPVLMSHKHLQYFEEIGIF